MAHTALDQSYKEIEQGSAWYATYDISTVAKEGEL